MLFVISLLAYAVVVLGTYPCSIIATTELVGFPFPHIDHGRRDNDSNSLPFLDIGKVLAGIQVLPEDSQLFVDFLQNLGYPYVEETGNEMYKKLLLKRGK
jgi:hypothetical protein